MGFTTRKFALQVVITTNREFTELMRYTDIKPKYDIGLGIVGMTDARIIEEVIHLLRREGVPEHEVEEFRTQTRIEADYDFGSAFLRAVLSWVKVIEMGSDHVACLDEGEEVLWSIHDQHEANLELEADLHGTGTQMYKDTLMLLGRAKKELGI